MQLFSQRNRKVPDTYSYEIDERARTRILHVLKQQLDMRGETDIPSVMEEAAQILLRQLGTLKRRPTQFPRNETEMALEHYFCCSSEEVMDLFQVCFHTRHHAGGEQTVKVLNGVLEDENVGFELSPFHVEIVDCDEGPIVGYPPLRGAKRYVVTYPTVIKKDEKLLHRETVQTCLHVLTDKRFKSANAELLNAFDEYRKGRHADAITDAGSAVESVLKTICQAKRWTYDPNATCAKLLDVCRDKGLFHPFYVEILKATGQIRNKLGDAHGKGPAPEYTATKEFADHMIYTACTNINLLISLAKL